MATNNYGNGDIFVMCSDDPLLKLDCSQELIALGRSKLPDAEFMLFTHSDLSPAGGAPNLKLLENEMSDPGLFGGDRIIKIILKDLDATAVELFKLIAGSFRPGLFIVIDLPRVTKATINVKPVDPTPLKHILSFAPGSSGAALLEGKDKGKDKAKGKSKRTPSLETRKKEAVGYMLAVGAKFLPMYPPEGDELRNWIGARGHKYGVTIDANAIDYIARACDNNLLIIDHSLQLMEMMREGNSANATLSLEDAEVYFTQDSRYTGFELPVAIFSTDSLKALNIISSFCSGEGMNKTAAVSLLISRMDESINAVYQGKKEGIHQADYNKRMAFFMANNIRVIPSQEAHLKAIRSMPDEMLDFLNLCLTEASEAFSHFDVDGAYRALQRMCLANRRSVTNLSDGLFA